MGEPLREERRRDRLNECFLLASHLGIADPLSLPVAEFDGLLELIGRGELVRSKSQGDPCRSYVEDWLTRGG